MPAKRTYVTTPGKGRGNYPPDLHAYVAAGIRAATDMQDMVRHIRKEWPAYSHITHRTLRNMKYRIEQSEAAAKKVYSSKKEHRPHHRNVITLPGPAWSHPEPKEMADE